MTTDDAMARSWDSVVVRNREAIGRLSCLLTAVGDAAEVVTRAVRDALTIPTGRN